LTTKILVTGSSGQIGSELVPFLKKRYGAGQVKPTVYPPQSEKNLSWHADVLDVVDMPAVTAALKDGDINTVYHLGGILSGKGEENPQLAWEVNVLGLKNVLDAARTAGVSRVFWPSSVAVFGANAPKSMTPQDAPLNPSTMYGLTKVTGELLCNYYYMKYGLDIRCLRYPGIVSSETMPAGGTTDYAVEMFYAAVKGERYSCFVRRETVLPMMFMADALRGAVFLMESDPSRVPRHSGYNMAAVSFSAGELEDAIRRRVPNFRVTYSPDSRQKIADSWPTSIDDTPAREDWGWRHEYDLERMVDEMLARLRAKSALGQKDG
jgi:nucleoside-diphosphate-sugar epimerase